MQTSATSHTGGEFGSASERFAHPDYGHAWTEWRTVEDAIGGTTRIKQEGITYLPRLTGQTDEEYASYRKRAVVFNATRRTRDALTGLLMRKPPVLTLPGKDDTDQPLLADITMGGESVFQWIRQIADAMVSTGRMASVIDYNEDAVRPYIATYRARDVLNWAVGNINGHRLLTMLVVREREETVDDYTVEKRNRYRAYRLIDGKAHYRTWLEGDPDAYKQAEERPMTRRGKALTRIPAVFHNATHLGPDIGESPLYDLAEINLAHYRGSADLENGRHLAGLPTPWATGVDSEKTDMRLGTSTMLTTENADAKFGFLEFTGKGLEELRMGQEEKEKQMAILGARLLSEQKRDAEAYETVRLRATSESAALTNIAGHMTVTLTEALQWFYWWQGAENSPSDIDCSIVVNKDFVDASIDSQTLAAVVSAFQQNTISFETFYHVLREGEIYPDDWDIDREAAAIAQRPPATIPAPPPSPGDNPEDEEDEDEEDDD